MKMMLLARNEQLPNSGFIRVQRPRNELQSLLSPLVKQPLDTSEGVLNKFYATLQLWPVGPEPKIR